MKYVNENGRSMVEMLGVLAIIGVLSVGGIAGYSKAMNKFKINKTTDQVTMLVANIRTLYSSQGNYEGLNNETAVSYGVVPNDMIVADDTGVDDARKLKNAFAGSVTIKAVPARKGNTANEAFVVAYDGLTEEACAAMLTGDWGSGQASGLISIGGCSSTTAGTVTTAHTLANTIFTDNQSSQTETNGQKKDVTYVDAGAAVGAPGGKVNVPFTVADAVKACDGGNSGNSVAWKYY